MSTLLNNPRKLKKKRFERKAKYGSEVMKILVLYVITMQLERRECCSVAKTTISDIGLV
jgi:hypothetical protein